MGVDFIRSQSGQPHTKRWAGGVDRLKQPDLFELNFEPECRFITAELVGGAPSPGDEVLLQADGKGGCAVFSGHSRVASLDRAPEQVLTALDNNYGIIPAIVDRIGCLGGTIELRLT